MAFERVSKLPLAYGDAVDVSHHISDVSKARFPSPLKKLAKYLGQPNLLSLAGGLPSPEYFPFESLKADTLAFDSYATAPGSQKAAESASSNRSNSKNNLSWLWNLFAPNKPTVPIGVPKFPSSPTDINLASALQYGVSRGLPQLDAFIKAFTAAVYRPAYANWTTLAHTGNTDGLHKAVETLCNPGEGILMSEWTYPSAIFDAHPYGVNPVPVGMDSQGMSAVALREVLSGWDVQARGGMPRPHVMYIVPVGQNPTGATMLADRKKEIYEICVEYDIIIIEDDPYYFLQEGEYKLPSERALTKAAGKGKATSAPGAQGASGGPLSGEDEAYLKSLVPTFLAFDYQGRVIRLDTFSKTIAPGSRLGWFTCNPVFAERLERLAETSSQAPCGFGQSIITQLLTTWGLSGYTRWVRGLGTEYTERRNFFLDCVAERFNVVRAPKAHTARFAGSDVYFAYEKEAPTASASRWFSEKTGFADPRPTKAHLFSFVPPTSGMFVWVSLNFEGHPKLADEGQQSLEMKLWVKLAEAGLLLSPGEIFSSVSLPDNPQELPGHFRLSFSFNPYDEIKRAIDIFAAELKKFNAEE
ncbi:hypothetical protein D9619_000291 [Psilocybe cf. subviscida]|uniref:Aminotransferase class I/classII large domain-containing protein n=1 Tax=Psilocybe cf. subviscida TaxID=2480587 RepID=A0A8H5BIM3_9AGAR|nr:hypothetical protein D9619_000291 [Psilocybe cf. subviscida]